MSTTTPHMSAEDCRQRATTRGTVIIAEAAPLSSLWAAGRLHKLLTLDMSIVIVDVIYDQLTRDQTNRMSQTVKALIDGHQPPFVIASTEIGEFEREKRRNGQATKSNAVELGAADFMSSDEGLRHYVSSGEPVLIMSDNAGLRLFNGPANLHVVSSKGLFTRAGTPDINEPGTGQQSRPAGPIETTNG